MASQPHTGLPGRPAWTDERLDELARTVREGFARSEENIGKFRSEMTGRFTEVDNRFGEVDRGFVQVDERFAQVDKRFAQVDRRFDQMDEHFDRMDLRFENMEGRFDRMDMRFERMEDRFGALQRTMLVGTYGITGAILATLITALIRF